MERNTQDNNTSVAIGRAAEHAARQFLEDQGLTLLQENFTVLDDNGKKRGEIDLIMRDQAYYVFIEVKMRKRSDHGAPIEMIPKQKQTNIIHAATIYLIRNYLFCKVFCRFDVVGISPASENQQTPDITWIKDAFQVQY